MTTMDGCASQAYDEEGEDGAAPSGLFWVAIYLTDRVWGGPEEGGWFYDDSSLITDPDIYAHLGCYPAAFGDEGAARSYAERMSAGIAALNVGRPPRDSVLSIGEHEVLVLQAPALPQHWPETRPRYE